MNETIELPRLYESLKLNRGKDEAHFEQKGRCSKTCALVVAVIVMLLLNIGLVLIFYKLVSERMDRIEASIAKTNLKGEQKNLTQEMSRIIESLPVWEASCKGEKGSPEVPGIRGLKGNKGKSGLSVKGQKGDKGEIGNISATGRTGNSGEKGERRETGSTGTKGQKGEKGSRQTEDNVFFTATLTTTLSNMGPNEIVVFDQVESQAGGAYSSSTGKFTAPVSGTYLFLFFVETAGIEGKAHVNLFHDGIWKSTALVETKHDGHDATSSNAAVLYVKRGEGVWVQTARFSTYKINYWRTTFSGALLHAW